MATQIDAILATLNAGYPPLETALLIHILANADIVDGRPQWSGPTKALCAAVDVTRNTIRRVTPVLMREGCIIWDTGQHGVTVRVDMAVIMGRTSRSPMSPETAAERTVGDDALRAKAAKSAAERERSAAVLWGGNQPETVNPANAALLKRMTDGVEDLQGRRLCGRRGEPRALAKYVDHFAAKGQGDEAVTMICARLTPLRDDSIGNYLASIIKGGLRLAEADRPAPKLEERIQATPEQVARNLARMRGDD